jgi:hypothetical protein
VNTRDASDEVLHSSVKSVCFFYLWAFMLRIILANSGPEMYALLAIIARYL